MLDVRAGETEGLMNSRFRTLLQAHALWSPIATTSTVSSVAELDYRRAEVRCDHLDHVERIVGNVTHAWIMRAGMRVLLRDRRSCEHRTDEECQDRCARHCVTASM